jgi:hypothetical protein
MEHAKREPGRREVRLAVSLQTAAGLPGRTLLYQSDRKASWTVLAHAASLTSKHTWTEQAVAQAKQLMCPRSVWGTCLSHSRGYRLGQSMAGESPWPSRA